MKSTLEKPVLSGTPLIGEGNIVDSKSLLAVLKRASIPGRGFYPDGPMVWLGRQFHAGMSMSTEKTMDYALNSNARRSSLKVLPLKWELRQAIKRALTHHPDAMCFITSQSIMAEECADSPGNLPVIMISSDINGKFSHDSIPSERQKQIVHLAWNRESLDFYRNTLNLPHVRLITPVDPKEAFKHIERLQLPFQEALDDRDTCFIKLSGSGGDPALINGAITSLWEKSRVRSIVFPGTEKTQKRIVNAVGKKTSIHSSLDPAIFYNQAREMLSHEHMLLTYPSEQVKHVAVLAHNNIFPKIVWLPPRGHHEAINMAWAINKGFSGTICIPHEYHSRLHDILIHLGVSHADIEFTLPENLSAEHFKPSPPWQYEAEAVPLEDIIREVA